MNYNPEKHVYIISYAKLPSNVSAAVYVGHLGLGFIVNHQTGVIEDISCTLLTKVARNFLKNLIIGYNIHENSIEPLIEKVKLLFHGNSQKAICVVLKDNYNKYNEWKNRNLEKLLEISKNNCYNDDMKTFCTNEAEKKYPANSTYIISYSKIPHNMSLAFYEGYTGIGFVIDFLSDKIIDCCCTFITTEAKDFMKSIAIGCDFKTEEDLMKLINKIKFCFNGPSQKAVCVIAKSNYNKYFEWKQNNKDYIESLK